MTKRLPILHLLLNFQGQAAPALGTIWDFILSDPSVLQGIREAGASGNDLAVEAVTDPSGVLATRPYFNIRQCALSEFSGNDAFMLAPYMPAGVTEVRVHLTGREAAALAILLHRYWPEHQQISPHKEKISRSA